MDTKLKPYQQIIDLLKPHSFLTYCVLGLSFLVAVSEGLGVGLVIPLLQSSSSSANDQLVNLPLLDEFIRWIMSMSITERIRLVAVSLLGIAVIRGIFLYSNRLLSITLGLRVEKSLKKRVFKKIIQMELGSIHQEKIGNLFTVLDNFTRKCASITRHISSAFVNVFTIFIYSILMWNVSWELALMAMVLLLLVTTLIKRRYSSKLSQVGKRANTAIKSLNGTGLEILSGIKLIRLFAKEHKISKRYRQSMQKYMDRMYQQGKLVSLMDPLFSTLNVFVLALLLIASTFLLPQNGQLIGKIILFILIMYRLMSPAATLNKLRAEVVSLLPALNDTLTLLERKDQEKIDTTGTNFNELTKGIRFKNVTFAYAEEDGPILKELSLNIPKGQMAAIVGTSGSGKTTLVNLIARLYTPQAGQICIDDNDLTDLNIESWRSNIALVSQDTFIFHDTVMENLKFASDSASEEDIYKAAQLADIHDFILSLPKGYNTILGDRGVRLSGGQQQRLSIARAVLSDPQLLILDEATSNLDSETEQRIQQSVASLSKGRTVIAVAHRLSTIRDADNIIVLHQGNVVEQGTHQNLVKLEGYYSNLVKAQDSPQTNHAQSTLSKNT